MIEQSVKSTTTRVKRLGKPELCLFAVPLLLPLLVFGWMHVSKTIESRRIVRVLTGAIDVDAIAFSPDGKLLAAGDGSVRAEMRLWDFKTGRLLHTIKTGHNAAVWTLTFSPDSKVVVTSGRDDGRLLFWDVQTGKLLRQFTSRQWLTDSLIFSPDGQTLVSAGHNRNGTIEVWDVQTGQLRHLLNPNQKFGFAAIIMPDGKTLFSAGTDGTKAWDLYTGKLLRELKSKFSETEFGSKAVTGVTIAVLSPNGKLLAMGSRKGDLGTTETVKVWNLQTSKVLHTITGKGRGGYSSSLRSISFSPDSTKLAIGCFQEPLRLWNVQTGKLLRTFRTDANFFDWIAFSPDSKTMASGQHRIIFLWNLTAPEQN